MINTSDANYFASSAIQAITQWHYDRNLIEGTTSWHQTKKYLEEFIELLAAQHPGTSPENLANIMRVWIQELLEAGRIKQVDEEDKDAALQDAIGDMAVVAINIAEREGFSFTEALNSSYNEIKDRKGRMIQGMYVKEEDLTD